MISFVAFVLIRLAVGVSSEARKEIQWGQCTHWVASFYVKGIIKDSDAAQKVCDEQ